MWFGKGSGKDTSTCDMTLEQKDGRSAITMRKCVYSWTQQTRTNPDRVHQDFYSQAGQTQLLFPTSHADPVWLVGNLEQGTPNVTEFEVLGLSGVGHSRNLLHLHCKRLR